MRIVCLIDRLKKINNEMQFSFNQEDCDKINVSLPMRNTVGIDILIIDTRNGLSVDSYFKTIAWYKNNVRPIEHGWKWDSLTTTFKQSHSPILSFKNSTGQETHTSIERKLMKVVKLCINEFKHLGYKRLKNGKLIPLEEYF